MLKLRLHICKTRTNLAWQAWARLLIGNNLLGRNGSERHGKRDW